MKLVSKSVIMCWGSGIVKTLVVVFALFYCLLDLRSSECNVVCFVLPCQWICLFCVLRVCELFGETIRNMFECVCYFLVEGDGVVVCG